jgi:hypothetical protein
VKGPSSDARRGHETGPIAYRDDEHRSTDLAKLSRGRLVNLPCISTAAAVAMLADLDTTWCRQRRPLEWRLQAAQKWTGQAT